MPNLIGCSNAELHSTQETLRLAGDGKTAGEEGRLAV